MGAVVVAASRTARYVALYRALETIERRRAPLFRDPFAAAFLSPGLALALRAARFAPLHAAISRYADRRAPGARASAIVRTRFIDDVVRRATATGVRQLVLLGAGFDCRAHRMPELAATRVFEVDCRETQAAKRTRLARATAPRRADVRYVEADFQRDDPAARLAAAGWDAGAATAFVWEGVTNYLTGDAVARVLSWVGRGAPGSVLAFTYVHAGLLDGSVRFEDGDAILRNVRRLAEPWTFGLRPEVVSTFLARFGLRLCDDAGLADLRARAPGGLAGRGYAFYRVAVAGR